jgi:hypothetical protein
MTVSYDMQTEECILAQQFVKIYFKLGGSC